MRRRKGDQEFCDCASIRNQIRNQIRNGSGIDQESTSRPSVAQFNPNRKVRAFAVAPPRSRPRWPIQSPPLETLFFR